MRWLRHVHRSGMSRRVVRLVPIGNVKGQAPGPTAYADDIATADLAFRAWGQTDREHLAAAEATAACTAW